LPSPTSTPFPYTTLFRSGALVATKGVRWLFFFLFLSGGLVGAITKGACCRFFLLFLFRSWAIGAIRWCLGIVSIKRSFAGFWVCRGVFFPSWLSRWAGGLGRGLLLHFWLRLTRGGLLFCAHVLCEYAACC